jgi:hypothetical protein
LRADGCVVRLLANTKGGKLRDKSAISRRRTARVVFAQPNTYEPTANDGVTFIRVAANATAAGIVEPGDGSKAEAPPGTV